MAATVHSFLDGWSVATVQLAVPLGLRVAVPLAVAGPNQTVKPGDTVTLDGAASGDASKMAR